MSHKSSPKGTSSVHIEKNAGYVDMKKDYTESDLKLVYEHSHPHNWDEAIDWIKNHADENKKITPGEAIAMDEDLQKLKDSGAQFTDDPHRAFEMAHKNRK